MSRMSRVVVPGVPHHVTQRGNARQVTFLNDNDRQVYMDRLRGNRQEFGLRIWAYCLMNNHVHLLAVPEREDSLARTLGRTHAEYALYWNNRRNSCGHVWQARFYSCPIEDEQVPTVVRYIETNPVRAGLAKEAESWPWSSALAHTIGDDASGLLDTNGWTGEHSSAQTSVDDPEWRRRLEDATVRGRPLGSEEFVDRLERALGFRLRPKPAGRPPRCDGTAAPDPRQMSLEIGE
jgi:putative transposase